MSRLALLIAGICLVVGVAISIFNSLHEEPAARTALSAVLPKQINGWVGEDLPLGDMEVTNAASRLLNYDDYVYRVYRRAGIEVYVYTMYWKQGSISVREIAGHTPDGCWVSNGAQLIGPPQTSCFSVGARNTAPAEVRQFAFPNGQTINVAWWHLWGDNLVDRGFDRRTLSPTLRELWTWLAKRRGVRCDQLLVRIHTTGNLQKSVEAEPVVVLLTQLPQIFTATPL